MNSLNTSPCYEDASYSLSKKNKLASQNTVADLFVHYLEQLQVDYVFGVPGGAIEPLYNALARAEIRKTISTVIARHETGAAFMAQGYANESAKLGVCCATTGPGATNILTGVASAYQDEVPMLVITGQTAIANYAKPSLQNSSSNGVDTIAIFKSCTRYNALISSVEQFEQELVNAIGIAYGPVKGPVHLSIPVDIFRQVLPHTQPRFKLEPLMRQPSTIDLPAFEDLKLHLESARKIVLLIGEQCQSAIAEIIQFCEIRNIAFVTSLGAKGLINPHHELYFGVFGFAGHDSARQLLAQSDVDCVLAVGTALSEWDTLGWDKQAIMNSRLVHIDPVAMHHVNSPMASLHVCCDIKAVFNHLIEYFSSVNKSSTQAITSSAVKASLKLWNDKRPRYVNRKVGKQISHKNSLILPSELMNSLAQFFPSGARFFADAGNSTAWAVHDLHYRYEVDGTHLPQKWFHTSTRFASMGWALGQSIGASFANRQRHTICITGDGSWLMNGQELTVAVQEHLAIVFVVMNDGAYGMVKHGQRLAKAEPIGFELPAVNFVSLAKAMGARAFRISHLRDLYFRQRDILSKSNGPVVLDVQIDPEAVPPMAARVEVLGGER